MLGDKEKLFKDYINRLLRVIKTTEAAEWEYELWALLTYANDLHDSYKKYINSNKMLGSDSDPAQGHLMKSHLHSQQDIIKRLIRP